MTITKNYPGKGPISQILIGGLLENVSGFYMAPVNGIHVSSNDIHVQSAMTYMYNGSIR